MVQVDYPDAEGARRAQEQISGIVKNKLASILEEAFNIYGKELFIRVRKMKIDLGDIPEEDLSTQLPKKFEKEIRKIFSGFNNEIYNFEGSEEVDIIDEQKLLLDYFTHYLKYGTMPWYMQDVIGEHTISELFSYLLEKNTEEFKSRITGLLDNSATRERFVRFLNTEEMKSLFKQTLTSDFQDTLQSFNDELFDLISNTSDVKGKHKKYLKGYLKEFLLITYAMFLKNNQSFNLVELTNHFISFVSKEKNLSPEKWMPLFFRRRASFTGPKESAYWVVQTMRKYYVDYIFEKKNELFLTFYSVKEPLSKAKAREWLTKKDPYLWRVVEQILQKTIQSFPGIEKDKLEQIIWRIAQENLPATTIKPVNVKKWASALAENVSEVLGIPEIQLSETSKQIPGEQKAKYEQEELQIKKKEDINLSVARNYLDLFLTSGLKPFKRLYKEPVLKLNKMFFRFLTEEQNVLEDILLSRIGDDNLLGLWRVREILSEELAASFEKIIRDKKPGILPGKLNYNSLLLKTFIRTGSFPWPEIINKGYEYLVNIINSFIDSSEKRDELIKVIKEEGFFENKKNMAKVFSIMPVEFNKELMKLRSHLVREKGEISLKGKTHEKAENIVDVLAGRIVEFGRKQRKGGSARKEHADFVFEEIKKAARRALYETAAMLVSIDKKYMDILLHNFDRQQKLYIRKLVSNYRVKFVSMAEEIEENERKSSEEYKKFDSKSEEKAFFVHNAGLVLLNPYLKMLFKRLKLTENKKFVSEEKKEKAALLLQYLARKDEAPEEHELTLNKLLVGLPLSAPFKFDISITEEEKRLCDSLLDGVIKNWTALKNTSIDGLRTSFLMREGSLRKEEIGWMLRIEKKAYDILLERLPWGFGLIHYPWMEKPLYTEWGETKK